MFHVELLNCIIWHWKKCRKKLQWVLGTALQIYSINMKTSCFNRSSSFCPCEIPVIYMPISDKNVKFDLANQISEALLIVCELMFIHQITFKSMSSYVSSSLINSFVLMSYACFYILFTEWRHRYVAVLSIRWTQEGKMKVKCRLQEVAMLPLRLKVIIRYTGLFKVASNQLKFILC